jgi:hypothetical protein
MFHLIIRAKRDDIININSNIKRRLPRDWSTNKNTGVMNTRMKTKFGRLENMTEHIIPKAGSPLKTIE